MEALNHEGQPVYQEILYDVENPIAKITLNRPDRLNAWTERMGAELKHALARAEADPQAVVIAITGAGRGWCAGADMAALQGIAEGDPSGGEVAAPDSLDADPGDPEMQAFRHAYTYLTSVRKPIIAVINGPCAGMAVPIALACDLRFASDRALFTTSFSQRGLIAEWGLSWLLPRVVGPAHAFDLLFSARKIDGAEAERMGLVNRCVPHDELEKFVEEYAREIAAKCSPASMRVMKRQVYEALHEDLSAAHDKAVQLMTESFEKPDFAEGIESFVEGRPPKFDRIGED